MTKKDSKTIIPECPHPLDQAFDQPREDGSDKWDKICGVCGITMCEVANPGLSTEAQETGLVQCGNTGCLQFNTAASDHCMMLPDGRELNGFTSVADCGFTKGNSSLPPENTCDDMPAICINTECSQYNSEEPNGCEECAYVEECDEAIIKEVTSEGPAAEAEAEGTEEGMAAAGNDAGDGAADQGGLKEKLLEHHNNKQSESYVTREADKIGGRFQELLPVPVEDHELGQLGIELAEQTSLWRRTKLDAKKFAKAAKEVTDRCEERMIELEEIIQDHARMAPVDVQWEFDFTAGVKKLRRCDTWEIVKEETLTAEERQPSLFDQQAQQSESAVKQLRAVQGEAVEITPLTDDPCHACADQCPGEGCDHTEEPTTAETLTRCQICKDQHPDCDDCCNSCEKNQGCHDAQFCTLTGHDSICAVCTGECGDYTPGTAVAECPGFLAEITEKESKRRDDICVEDWRECPHAGRCFTPANEGDAENDGDCVCFKEVEAKAAPVEEVLF